MRTCVGLWVFPAFLNVSRMMVVQFEPESESPEPFRTVTLPPAPVEGPDSVSWGETWDWRNYLSNKFQVLLMV